jgi:hypothetical protein
MEVVARNYVNLQRLEGGEGDAAARSSLEESLVDCWVHIGTRADSNPNLFLSQILFRILFQTTHTLIL